jgi:hemolysin activation/secretion protein
MTSVVANVGLQGVSSEIKQDSVLLFKDALREVHLGFSIEHLDGCGSSILYGEFTQVMNIFGATDKISTRQGSKKSFTKFLINSARLQKLTNRLLLVLKGSTQVSITPLSSIFEFGLGGSEYGQAYNTSEITGQNGAGWKGELKYFTNTSSSQMFNSIIFGFFYDGGSVWGKHIDTSTIHSLGGNIHVSMSKYLNMGLMLAYPLGWKDNDGNRKAFRAVYQVKLSV